MRWPKFTQLFFLCFRCELWYVSVVELGPALCLCSCMVRSPKFRRRKKRKSAIGMPWVMRQEAARIGVFSPSHPYKALVEWGYWSECSPGSLFGMWEGAVSRDGNYISTPQASERYTITKWLNPPPAQHCQGKCHSSRLTPLTSSLFLSLDLYLFLSIRLCALQELPDADRLKWGFIKL